MVTINNLYEVKIYPSTDTNIAIDTNIGINLKVTDFNGNPITNKNITVTCDKGVFTQWSNYTSSGNYLHSLNNVKSFTGTTDNTGWFDCTYKGNEWGLCTISADVNKLQLFITGFKNTSFAKTPTNTCTLQVDESQRACRLTYNLPTKTITSSTVYGDTGIIPVKYRPPKNKFFISHHPDVVFTLTSDGSIGYRRGTSGSDFSLSATTQLMEWRY